MTRAIESFYLPGCSYVSAASPGIAEAYQQTYGIPLPTVILNVFPLADAPERVSVRGSAQPGPSVYWFSQTIGPDRGLECAAKAIGLARSCPHLYLQGNVGAAFRETLLLVAEQAGAVGRIHFLPPVHPAELARLASAFDVGFVGETGQTPNRRIALTNKLFTYWLAGVPCVASDIPAHRALADEVGSAMACFPVENPQALAVELDSLLSFNSGRLAEARQRAWQLSHQKFNWGSEKSRLIRCVSTALQS
jgi:glycosyltransferase involved in cell wall biosynthesis